MTGSRRSPRCAALASLAGLALLLALPSAARDSRGPLPIYIEDNHAGTFAFLAETRNLDEPCALVLVDAHPDSSRPRGLDDIRTGLRRVVTQGERDARIAAWRRSGQVQSFDWLAPLMPLPVARVVWVAPSPERTDTLVPATLPPGFVRAAEEELDQHLPPDLPVVVSIDLDAFAGLSPPEQASRFAALWRRITALPRLAAITFAISRPWLSDDGEASHLVLLALQASLSLAHATIRFEPWGIEGPDRSERAKAFHLARREPPRFDPEAASPELRSLLLSSAARLDVRLERGRWPELLARWRAEGGDWHVAVAGIEPDSEGIVRPRPHDAPDLRVEGGPPGRVRSVTWLRWTPRSWAYDVLPELPSGKAFAGTAPPVIDYEATVLGRTSSPRLAAAAWMSMLPGPDRTGVLRISADLETDDGVVHTARLEIRRGVGSGFRAGLSEQFGLPYVFGAGFLRRGALRGPDTGVGNDCANFLVHAWRRSGLRMPWSNPAQLRRHLDELATGARGADRPAIPDDAERRGLVIHLGSHVAALWEDRPPLGTLGLEDQVVHHLGGAPEVIALGELLERRGRTTFDLYLGPRREAVAWVAAGGDIMPGREQAPPAGLAALLREADLAAGNLETTVGEVGQAARKRYAFRVNAGRLAAVRSAGISAVSLANNHAGDFGPDGLVATLGVLDAAGVGHFGAGADTASAVAAWYGRARNTTVAFVAASLTDADLFPAGPGEPGVAVLPRHKRELAAAMAAARAKASVVIAMPHWGTEGTTRVTEEQRRWARWFVEQGADAVAGSGPHVLQAQETIAGVPVFYSLGNLWFEGPWPAASRRAGIAFFGLSAAGRVVATRLEEFSASPAPSSSPDPR